MWSKSIADTLNYAFQIDNFVWIWQTLKCMKIACNDFHIIVQSKMENTFTLTLVIEIRRHLLFLKIIKSSLTPTLTVRPSEYFDYFCSGWWQLPSIALNERTKTSISLIYCSSWQRPSARIKIISKVLLTKLIWNREFKYIV